MSKWPRARVFISCGQRKGTEEVRIAEIIKQRLEEMGFKPYVAVQEQTLAGLKENIFSRLETSEYLIFIDFMRERLVGRKRCYRGSLFTNQELAIASFLGIEALLFQEKGVLKNDGILNTIQGNCTEFDNRQDLPNLVVREVQTAQWEPKHQRTLWVENAGELPDVLLGFVNQQVPDETLRSYTTYHYAPIPQKASFYHLRVYNQHHRLTAHNCLAYVEEIRDLSTGETRQPELAELKWKGLTSTGVSIPPKKERLLDAFHVPNENPTVALIGLNQSLIDFTGILPQYQLDGPGIFQLTFVIHSDNFPDARVAFKLKLGSQLNEVKFSKKG